MSYLRSAINESMRQSKKNLMRQMCDARVVNAERERLGIVDHPPEPPLDAYLPDDYVAREVAREEMMKIARSLIAQASHRAGKADAQHYLWMTKASNAPDRVSFSVPKGRGEYVEVIVDASISSDTIIDGPLIGYPEGVTVVYPWRAGFHPVLPLAVLWFGDGTLDRRISP
jgi:hypothetical protein